MEKEKKDQEGKERERRRESQEENKKVEQEEPEGEKEGKMSGNEWEVEEDIYEYDEHYVEAEDVEDDITGEGWDHVDSSSITGTQGDDSFTVYKYKLCKGTRGYIQTNVGPNSDEKSRGLDYSVENPPGSADVETGNDRETNIIHPFIVFTEWNDDCYP